MAQMLVGTWFLSTGLTLRSTVTVREGVGFACTLGTQCVPLHWCREVGSPPCFVILLTGQAPPSTPTPCQHWS